MSDWKLDKDPYMGELAKERGKQFAEEAGYFIDTTTSPEDIDYMLDLPCTPLAWAFEEDDTDNDCVLLCTGSYNPVHGGHIDMLKAAKAEAERNGYRVRQAYMSPGHDEYIVHKSGDKAIPIHERIAMCEQACEPWMSVCPWEGLFNKKAIMFTHVIERLEQYIEHQRGGPIKVFFVCGLDNLNYAMTFINRGGCIVVQRPMDLKREKREAATTIQKIKELYADRVDELMFAPCNNPASSTKVREGLGAHEPQKTNLTLRVEDTMFDVDYRPLLDIIDGEYTRVDKKLLSKQEMCFSNMTKNVSTVSMDPLLEGDWNLYVSRHYDRFGSKMLRFDGSPDDYVPLDEQIDRIVGKHRPLYLFDDDIHTTGGTMRFITKHLEDRGIDVCGAMTLKVSDDSGGEILDMRDFIVWHWACGLVIEMGDRAYRAPYVYPYVCPYARASVTDPMGFSKKVWAFNRDMWRALEERGEGTNAMMLGTMGELFVQSGFARPKDKVSEICDAHLKFLESLE